MKHVRLIIALAVLGAAVLILQNIFPDRSLARYADAVIATCNTVPYPRACYDEELPRLMRRGLSMEETFAVTKLVQEQVPDYFYCHVLGHRLAEQETAKDVSQWTDVITRCPTGMCSNGCIHGAAQERFRAESLSPEEIEAALPELRETCSLGGARAFTGVEQASCYHSLGHLAMFMTAGKTQEALGVCAAIVPTEDGSATLCYEGVFMQIFQPLEPEDVALVRDFAPESQAEAHSFCSSFPGEEGGACHRESWPLARDTLSTAAGVDAFCSFATGAENAKRCYSSLFYVLVPQLNFEEEKIVALCDSFDEKRAAQCYASAASRTLETDERLIPDAARLCAIAADKGASIRCYSELLFYSVNGFTEGSEAFHTLCSALPEPWGSRCENGVGHQVRVGDLDL